MSDPRTLHAQEQLEAAHQSMAAQYTSFFRTCFNELQKPQSPFTQEQAIQSALELTRAWIMSFALANRKSDA